VERQRNKNRGMMIDATGYPSSGIRNSLCLSGVKNIFSKKKSATLIISEEE